MKRVHAMIAGIFLIIGAVYVYAANQYNWGTSTGGAWSTPDDTATTVGQPLQIGASGGAVAQAGGAALSMWPRTLAQLNALTPSTTGQIAFCSNCNTTSLVISSGTSVGAWVAASSATVHAI